MYPGDSGWQKEHARSHGVIHALPNQVFQPSETLGLDFYCYFVTSSSHFLIFCTVDLAKYLSFTGGKVQKQRGQGFTEWLSQEARRAVEHPSFVNSQWEFAVWLRKLEQGLCINLEGWDGEDDGREVLQGGDICIPMADSCWDLTENNNNKKKKTVTPSIHKAISE